MRFVAAQLVAYVSDGPNLRSARRANALAMRLADGLPGSRAVALLRRLRLTRFLFGCPKVWPANLPARVFRSWQILLQN
jgi:hypothetical protein